MASTQNASAPDSGRQQTTSQQEPTSGINWNGPAGFWLLLCLVIGATIVVGLYLA